MKFAFRSTVYTNGADLLELFGAAAYLIELRVMDSIIKTLVSRYVISWEFYSSPK